MKVKLFELTGGFVMQSCENVSIWSIANTIVYIIMFVLWFISFLRPLSGVKIAHLQTIDDLRYFFSAKRGELLRNDQGVRNMLM